MSHLNRVKHMRCTMQMCNQPGVDLAATSFACALVPCVMGGGSSSAGVMPSAAVFDRTGAADMPARRRSNSGNSTHMDRRSCSTAGSNVGTTICGTMRLGGKDMIWLRTIRYHFGMSRTIAHTCCTGSAPGCGILAGTDMDSGPRGGIGACIGVAAVPSVPKKSKSISRHALNR